MKTCSVCGMLKLLTEFPVHHYVDDKPIYRNQCNVCRQKVTQKSFNNRFKKDKKLRSNISKKKSLSRKDPDKRAKYILEDSRRSDKKKDRTNDLDIEFIKTIISKGCFYCGDNKTQICLDRIDNAQGHLKCNVNPACVRCNYIRNCMPYPAWLKIVPSIKETFEEGLFDDWHTRLW